MKKTLRIAATQFLMCLLASTLFGQSLSKEKATTSLCSLQQKVTEGGHQTVRVSGIFGPGLNHTILEDPACPAEGTWVELNLRSDANKQKLRRLLENSRRAYVEVDGEFYGSPLPDPKLPEAIRKSYHPGWGHLAAFKTKLVIHAIRVVKIVPIRTTPTAPKKNNRGQACDFAILSSEELSR